MDQTQQLQLGPFCPWSPPDMDNCPECPDWVRNKRLYWPLSPALSFLSLTLSILPCFSSPPVLDAGIWSKGHQPELRIRDWSPPPGRELEFWFWSGLISGRAEFQSTLLWRPREKSHNAWVSVGGRSVRPPLSPPSPASSHFFFQPGFLSFLLNLWC